MSTKRHTVLMITGRSDPGGGPEHLLQLAAQVVSSCRVLIAAPREEPYWDRFTKVVGAEAMVEIPHRRFSWDSVRRLVALVRAQSIDIIHSHGRAAGVYGRVVAHMTGQPSIHTFHGPLLFNSPISVPYWVTEFLLAGRTNYFIAVSDSEKETMQKQLLRRDRISTIPNGVSLSSFERVGSPFDHPPLRIAHVTRYVAQKNSEMVLEILEAVRRLGALDRFRVDMLGDGPNRATLTAQAEARDLASVMTFHGARPSLGSYFQESFCLLSTSRWEGLPIAVLEAMAVGCPSIATSVVGNIDIVTPEVGALFGLDEPELAAKHLVELSEQPARWMKLSTAARDLIQNRYSVERMAAETLEIYDRVVDPQTLSLVEAGLSHDPV